MKPIVAYVGIADCGFVMAICINNHDKRTAEIVANMIESKLSVHSITAERFNNRVRFNLIHQCGNTTAKT